MSWDIYGNPLQRGYCEVHPGVPEPWPCGLCMAESDYYRQPEVQPEPCQGCSELANAYTECNGSCGGAA